MISITRFDKSIVFINPHEIEFIEETPDTIITTVSGKKILVKEKAKEIIDRIVTYRARIVGESLNSASAGTER
ncbi:MAG: flagellar FlbD family protein [Spirochaetes bacterium]|nr:flagellar FlbD family protein [Spirochaetota bacterium]